MPSMKSIKRRMLKERGLMVEPEDKFAKRIRPVHSAIPEGVKTTAMKLVELQQRKPIEELLLSGSVRQVGRKLGTDYSTVSKWITRLNLRYTETNLPSCAGCKHANYACIIEGKCTVLVRLEAPASVILAKRRQLIAAKEAVNESKNGRGTPGAAAT